jgi:hypothetical protein
MAAAAIFENGGTLPVSLFRTQHVNFSLSIKFQRNRALNVELTHLIGLFSHKDAKMGVMKLLLGAKTRFWGRDKR